MRQSSKEFVGICAKTLLIREPIYEFGSLQVPGQEGYSDLRVFFPRKSYVGSDVRQGKGVDVILDLENIDLPDNSVETALCVDTLEHVECPWKAIEELHRVTRGIVIIVVPFFFRIHNYPKDYWRFTLDCLRGLLRPFESFYVSYAGTKDYPHTVIGIGFNSHNPDIYKFKLLLKKWQKQWSHSHIIIKNPIKRMSCLCRKRIG